MPCIVSHTRKRALKLLVAPACCTFWMSSMPSTFLACIQVTSNILSLHTSHSYLDEVPKSNQRLHSIGVELVGQLMWQLTAKPTSSLSSPKEEETRTSDLYMVMESMEEHAIDAGGDGMMISESSRDVESDVMEISTSKKSIQSNPARGEETIDESSKAMEADEKTVSEATVEQSAKKLRHEIRSPTMSPDA